MEQIKTKNKMQINEQVQLLEQHVKRKRAKHQCISTKVGTMKSVELATPFPKETADCDDRNRIVASKHYQIPANEHDVHSTLNTSNKKGHIVHPCSVFEKGSTSYASKEQHNIPSETIKGTTNENRNILCINELRTSYVPLKKVLRCKFCDAVKFDYESSGFCCSDGSVKLVSHKLPVELRNLYFENTEESKHFRTYVRTYNNMFAFTSLGVHYDKNLARRDHGIYTFRVQGQIYHFIEDLYSADGKAKYLQLYFYDNDNEVANRMMCSDKINETIVRKLMDILKINPYTIFLKRLMDIPNIHNHYIALKCDLGLDQRVYNLPTTSEVAAIWIDQSNNNVTHTPHIKIYTHNNRSQLVNYYYGCYDALQYPLIFPYGQNGWHCGIQKIGRLERNSEQYFKAHPDQLPSIKNMSSVDEYLDIENKICQRGKKKRDTISVREYYCYKFQIRSDDEDEILHTGRVFQQYSIDAYIKLETQRLDFVSFNQDLFRMDVLQGLLDILRLGERNACNVGKQKFLPASFIGGPRDMRQRYMDAIALVQYFGKPDLFITMTCNPTWPEIKEHLLSIDEAHNRPDLISRVFRAKVEELKTDITKRNIFGKVAVFMYTIEFQKRGLPHVHFLIILANEYKLITPEAYDSIISAELPNIVKEPDLYRCVVKHMMHGPCGDLNPTNSCMKKVGCCKFNYPKQFANQTSKGKDAYPIYKRRNTENTVKMREKLLDNSWVVPYNPFLLGKFNCHMNVEVCSDIKVVKNLYKYICKGHDKIAFAVNNNEANTEIDEIKEYQSARWVSPPEARWRFFGFPISEMNPSVYHLQLHLEGQQFISFKSNADVNTILKNPMIRRTMLTEFFHMNRTNNDAIQLNLLYKEYPEHFVWSTKDKMWTRRKQRFAVGRVVTCHPTEGERYYLRLLLMNVRCPKSYRDLLTVNGKIYSTFRESAEKRGLLHCDSNLADCMCEAITYQLPYSLRRLFAILLVYCEPTNLRELWEKFEQPMSEDYKILHSLTVKDIRFRALNHINDILHSMGHDINEYKLFGETIRASPQAREMKETHFERNITITEEDLFLHKKLNKEQQNAYDTIIHRIFSNRAGAFFIDGPGGTGKTFLYRALLATVRSKAYIALATTTSGVAASLLSGGRTTHSRFKIPIDIDENFSCNISKQSALAQLIRDARLIVWDEVSMAKKKMVETLDLLLRDLMDTNILFGGKVIVFGDDFRQTLPIVRNGKKEDFINESLLYSHIWNQLEKLSLSINMRARKDPAFCNFLMRIGNGTEKENLNKKIEIPSSLIIPFTTEKESLNALFDVTYPNIRTLFADTKNHNSRVILTTKNDFVNEINEMLITKFPNRTKTFIAVDETIEPTDQSQFEDFLHTLNPAGLPPYKLTLKENCPIILLWNLNPCEGLCNGTRLICCDFKTHVISAKIVTGDFKNTHVFIPRIPLLSPGDDKSVIPFKRIQFPVRLCFAMTINKAQGQTLDFAGIYLREPVFSHGQLYVALSRAKSSNCVKVLIRPPTSINHDDHSTINIVYNEIIKKAFS